MFQKTQRERLAIFLILIDASNPSRLWCWSICTLGFEGTRWTNSKSRLEQKAKNSQSNLKNLMGGSHLPGVGTNDKGTVNKQCGLGAGPGSQEDREKGPAAQRLVAGCAPSSSSLPFPEGPALEGSQRLFLPGAWGANKLFHCSFAQ